MYGSIGTKEISESLIENGFEIDRQAIRLPEGVLKDLGNFELDIELHPEVISKINVLLKPENKIQICLNGLRWENIKLFMRKEFDQPSSLEAEKAVLGGLLLKPDLWDTVSVTVMKKILSFWNTNLFIEQSDA